MVSLSPAPASSSTTAASASPIASPAVVSSRLTSSATAESALVTLLRLANLVDDLVGYSQVFNLRLVSR